MNKFVLFKIMYGLIDRNKYYNFINN